MKEFHLSTRQFFLDLVKDHEPLLEFRGRTRQDFERWQPAFRQRFMECVGPLPEPVPLSHSVEWEVREEGLIKQKIYLHTAKLTAVPCLVLRPDNRTSSPAIVCIHGHERGAKDSVGGARYPIAMEQPGPYGLLLARAGFATICPDLRPHGERGELMPGEVPYGERDACNIHALKGWLLGFNLMTYNLWDCMKCIDFMLAQEWVTPGGVGTIGGSLGGAMTMHLGALDERVKATAVITALNSYRGWAVGIDNFCGIQFLPGMFQYGDHAEICGLIAPRALKIEIGGFDHGFPPAHSVHALKRVEAIYAAAGCPEKLHSYIGYAGHQFYNVDTEGFFRRWLCG